MALTPVSGPDPARSGGIEPPRPRRTSASEPANEPRHDRIEVSDDARELAKAVESASDLRFDIVSRLRSQVRAGTYTVDAKALARAMVQRGERDL